MCTKQQTLKIHEAKRKEKVDKSTAIAGDLNTPVSTMDGTTRQAVSKDMEELTNRI